jgi:periplasmic divalent cation tolerance protein
MPVICVIFVLLERRVDMQWNGMLEVTTTTETETDARRLARELVNRRLAACAQVSGPIRSYYWWKGSLEEVEEWRCVLKTMSYLYTKVESAIRELHPYTLPQIMAVPVQAALAEYLTWVQDNISGSYFE